MNMDQDAHPHLKGLLRGFQNEPGSFCVRISGRFESAHYLYRYFPDGSDEPLHGHSWLVEVFLGRADGGLGQGDMAVDFLAARRRLDELTDRLEHVTINTLEEFVGVNPTAENIARWFFRGIRPAAEEAGGRVVEVRVHEGPDNFAIFRPVATEERT